MGKKRRHSKSDCSVTEKKLKREKYGSTHSEEERGRVDKQGKRNKRHKHKLKAKHRKKRKVSSDSSSASDSDISTTSSASSLEQKRKKLKKAKCKKSKHEKLKNTIEEVDSDDVTIGPLPPIGLSEKAKSMAPMTKDEWETRQSVVKRVFDEETGRHRLVKGDGEILEEIVSRDRHKEINRQATAGDSSFFQSKIKNKLKSV